MIPLRPILDLWPGDPDIPEDEPTRDEDWAHEETEAEYKNTPEEAWAA